MYRKNVMFSKIKKKKIKKKERTAVVSGVHLRIECFMIFFIEIFNELPLAFYPKPMI